MDEKERRSYLFVELLACLENLDYKNVITDADLRNFSLKPGEMTKHLYEKVHASRLGSGKPNMYSTSAGEELTRIFDKLTFEDMNRNEKLEPIYLLAKHKMSSELRKKRSEN